MVTLIADCESNGLLRQMTKLHCVQVGSEEGDDAILYGDNAFCDAPLAEGLRRLREADKVVFHNGLGYDFWAINHFAPGTLRFEQIFDTLVLSRMKNIGKYNHSLAALGEALGVPKDKYKGDYQVFDQEFADYSRQDIMAGRAIWRDVRDVLAWGGGKVYDIEARAAYCVARQEQSGIAFDVKRAQALHATLAQEKADLLVELKALFPDFKREQVFVPKVNNKKMGYQKGVPFVKKWDEEFNPRSRDMIGEALIRDGWQPQVLTETGKPKVDEKTLASMSHHPGAAKLIRYLKTSKILGDLIGEKAGKGYLSLVKDDGRIYGRVNTLGASTWRMTHSNPNTANIAKDPRVRGLFVAEPGWELVGCDAAEIQARFLAHYLHAYDGGAYKAKLLSGSKAEGTDGHSLNWAALKPFGCVSRDGAKQALYARVFGCYSPRMLATLNEFRSKAGVKLIPATKSNVHKYGGGAIKALGESMPGLDDLLADVQKRGKERGWLRGIGGAQVPVAAAHAALVSLLQHGEAVTMKLALGIVEFETAPSKGWVYGVDYRYVSNVHDEVQTEVREGLGVEYGEAFSAAIVEAGVRLGVRCPMAGEAKVGPNWAITH